MADGILDPVVAGTTIVGGTRRLAARRLRAAGRLRTRIVATVSTVSGSTNQSMAVTYVSVAP